MIQAALLLLVLLLAGCGGIKSRISEHEREFAEFPPEAQAQIQSGRIDRGFTEDMVYMARGKPSEKETLLREGKKITVWRYPRPARLASPTPGSSSNLSTPYGYPGFGGTPSQATPLFYDRGTFRVEFENGKVTGWDEDLQNDSPR